MKKIKSSLQRRQTIESYLDEVKEDKKLGTKNISFRNGERPCPIVLIPSEYLMYRIKNTRTRRQQLRYLRNHPELPKDLFADGESQRAQDAQESILLDMIDATGQDFVRDLDEHGQDDPAIITFDGFIVNGNRRTAALRRSGKEYIKCVVLPQNTTQKEIYNLEIDLQMSKDFREEYHWVNELIDIEEGIKEHQETKEEIASRLRIKPPELNSKLRMKILVDKFLQWKGIPKQYDYEKLDEAEQDFFELEKETRKPKYNGNPHLLDQVEKAFFHLVDHKPKKGRSYAWERDLFKNFDQVYEKLEKEAPRPKKKQKTSDKSDELLDALTGSDTDKQIDLFGDSSDSENVSKLLQEAIKDVKAKNTEIKDAEAVYEAVSDALRELQGLTIYQSTAKLEAIYNKLEEIIDISTTLLKQVKNYRK